MSTGDAIPPVVASETTHGEVRHAAVSRFRGRLIRFAALSFVVFIGSILAVPGVDKATAVLLELVATVAAAAGGAAVLAFEIAPDYARARDEAKSRLVRIWGYLTRAAAWGLAAASMGVLLSEVVPARLAQAFDDDPNSLSIKGFLAVTFGSVAVAAALLEEWRQDLPE